MAKLTVELRKQIVEEYKQGLFTRYELAKIFQVSKPTIDRVLHSEKITKPFHHDAMNHRISIDHLSEKGYDIPQQTIGKTTKIVKCPYSGCTYRGGIRKLLLHLISKHGRHDLEYLLEENL